jgi:carboxyl-terminal processing protease
MKRGIVVKTMSMIFISSLVVFSSPAAVAVGHGDFSKLSFAQAFDSLFINFSTCYPFSRWKAVDWQSLYNEFAPQIAAAQSNRDTAAYKLALRHFLHRFPDGHVRIRGEFQSIFFGEIGGGIGLTLIEIDDGSIVVNRVLSGSPAQQAGIVVGAVISQWNGLPVNDALKQTDISWEGKPPTTLEATRLAQLRRLIRIPVGTQIEITVSNAGQDPATKRITAVDDGMISWDLTNYTKFSTNGSANLTLEDVFSPVQYKILESGYGYLKNRILAEFDSQGKLLSTYNNVYNDLKKAIDHFNAARVPGVIIDVRDNPGGFDRLAALFGSFFYDHKELYEHASFYNPQSRQFEVIGSFTIYLEPQSSYYGGPVICLVNAGTSSSAEGVALAVQRSSHGHVLGFRGTHGSFGLTSGESLMPAGLAISYPLGRSLNENFTIQIDSDSTKKGGVIPDIRVPSTRENMHAMFLDSEDVELNYAIMYLRNGPTSILGDQSSEPKTVQLYANYPNPFNPQTRIEYFLPKSTQVKITVYNVMGQEITTLVDDPEDTGFHTTIWSGIDNHGRNVGSSVYFYEIRTGNCLRVHKMVLVR